MSQEQESKINYSTKNTPFSQFYSMSGRAGILTGIYGLSGAIVIDFLLTNHSNNASWVAVLPITYLEYLLCFVAFLAALFSMIACHRSASRRARKYDLKFRKIISRKLLLRFFTPLLLGLLVSIFFYKNGMENLILPSTLLSFGVGCIILGITTTRSIWQFGIWEVILGVVGIMFPHYGLPLWGAGFGILPILYGLLTFNKYNKLKSIKKA